MKTKLLLFILIVTTTNLIAQKQTFDLVSFSPPSGWQQLQNEGGIQLSVSDKKTGAYAIAIITKATASDATPNENFTNDWTRLVKNTVPVTGEPEMQDPSKDKGWDIISGKAGYTDGGKKGLATLITATGGGQSVSVVLMTNTQQYRDELLSFVNSLELVKVGKTEADDPASTGQTSSSSVVGLWCDYILETTGYYVNGMPQYTAGYLRKEYAFYPDGTYLFRNKQWLTKTKDIVFIYESGTYEIHGSQLTLTPKTGKGSFWGKTASTKEWGKLIKSSDYKLEKASYTFTINIDPNYSNTIILKSSKPTQRDGGKFNASNDPYEFRYSFRKLESLIDNPPGLKTGFENKNFTTGPAIKPINKPQANTNKPAANSPIAGNWSYSISETQFGTLTNGYSTRQYSFKDDGTYLYRYKVFSSTMNVLLFQYENGSYTLNGNQLTISPLSGANEEWSQDKTHPDQWGKRLKTSKRKLEKVVYTFTLHYFSGIKETDLILQTSKATEREGKFGSMQDYPNGWAFKPCNPNNNPLIVTPPGFEKTVENNPEAASGEPNSNQSSNASNSTLAGRIWEGTTTEKFSNAGGTSYNTGGFTTNQYRFTADGTYRFVSVNASHYTDTKTLNYETGTYSAEGSQLTINPAKGYNEEWTKIGKTSNGNSDVANRAINETWGKKLNTSSRKLEQVSYTFSIGKNGDRTALVLQYSQGHTEREGNGAQVYLNETTPERSVKLPAEVR